MYRTTKSLLLLCFCSGIFSACNHKADLSALPAISFSNNVQSIIVGNCTQSGCHADGSDRPHSLTTYDDVIKRVSPGDANSSQLYERIAGQSGNIMPPAPQAMLTNDQIRTIYLWIEQGAKNN